MKLLSFLSIFALFAFSRAVLEDENPITEALTVEQEIQLLVTGDLTAPSCSANGQACTDSDQCCGCCKLNVC